MATKENRHRDSLKPLLRAKVQDERTETPYVLFQSPIRERHPAKTSRHEQRELYEHLSSYRFPRAATSCSSGGSYSSPISPLKTPPPGYTTRGHTHRRSTAISLSSCESIFDSIDSPGCIAMYEQTSPVARSHTPNTTVTPDIQGCEDISNKAKETAAGRDIFSTGDKELDHEEFGDEVGLLDFLRESESDQAMSITEDYNPLDYVQSSVYI